MSNSYEEISKSATNSSNRTDANLANDTNYLGGIAAGDYATKKYVQDYHDNKEATLRQDMATNDATMLQNAKDYTDTVVRNQDFSNFAKLNDVRAVREDLTEGLAEQQVYTDNKVQDLQNQTNRIIGNLTGDVNSNFSDMESAITTLNTSLNNTKNDVAILNTSLNNTKSDVTELNADLSDTKNDVATVQGNITTINTKLNSLDNDYDELFQSVSDGKSKIAEAITDKGITTSATTTFATMANNIKNITTTDTSDATATANDIKLGKTAYVNGVKIYGTNTEVDVSNITPSYGVDTSDATATASDIKFGQTAYINGQLVTGTYQDTSVQEIYEPGAGDYEIREISGCYETVFGDVTLNCTGKMAVDSTGTLIVRELTATINGEFKRFIASNTMGNDGIYLSVTHSATSSSDVYRKWLYSFEELGLDPDRYITYMSLGIPGFQGDSSAAALCIVQNNTGTAGIETFIHFYRYSLADNGYIGYNHSSEYPWHWIDEPGDNFYVRGALTCSNNNPNVFATLYKADSQKYGMRLFTLLTTVNQNGVYTPIISKSSAPYQYDVGDNAIVKFSLNDNYVYATKLGSRVYLCPVTKTEDGFYALTLFNVFGNFDSFEVLPDEEQVIADGQLYTITKDTEGYNKLTSSSETVYLPEGTYPYVGFSLGMQYCYSLKADAKYQYPSTYYGTSLCIYNVNLNVTEPWEAIQSFALLKDTANNQGETVWTTRYPCFKFAKDMTWGVLYDSYRHKLYKWKKDVNSSSLSAIVYQGNTYIR